MGSVVDRLYTPIEEAVAELDRRRQKPIECGNDEFRARLEERPYAVLARYVQTPNLETERFVALARSVGLTPLVTESYEDKFVSGNSLKRALARMPIIASIDYRGRPVVRKVTVADIQASDGHRLSEVATLWGQALIDFHHELVRGSPLVAGIERYDTSAWSRRHGRQARDYYTELLSVYTRAVLFETFLLSDEERAFTTGVVIPAFDSVCRRTGLRPLICRLDPPEQEGDRCWLCYPSGMHKDAAARLGALGERERPTQVG